MATRDSEMNRRSLSMQAGACSGIAQQIPNDNTMIAITGKSTAPSAWMATDQTPACGESELLGYLKGCIAVKDKRDQNLLELDRHISLIYAQGRPDLYTDRMEMTHLAVLFSTTAVRTCTLIKWIEFIIQLVEVRPDAARFAWIDDLKEEIARLWMFVRCARDCKSEINRWLAEGCA